MTHQQPRGVHRLGGIAVVAGAELLLLAEEAVAAADRERHDDAVALVEAALRADLDDLAHELVAKHVAWPKPGDVAVVKVKVGPADSRRGDP